LHEREQRLHQLPGKPGIERDRLIQAFLRPPLRHTRYREGHGTLYTASGAAPTACPLW